MIIPVIQLGESRQPRRAHPVLKMLVARQLREVRGVVRRAVPQGPVGRWDDLGEVGVAGRVGVLLGFAGPGYSFVGEVVGRGLVALEDGLGVRV